MVLPGTNSTRFTFNRILINRLQRGSYSFSTNCKPLFRNKGEATLSHFVFPPEGTDTAFSQSSGNVYASVRVAERRGRGWGTKPEKEERERERERERELSLIHI